LMQVVARQEEEIRDLRAAVYGGDDYDVDALGDAELDAPESLGEVDVQDEWDEDWNFDDEDDDFQEFEALGMEEEVEDEGGGFHIGKPLAGVIAAGVAGVVGGLARKLLDNRGGGEMDVEVELEPRPAASVVDDRAGRYTASGVADAREAMAMPPAAGYADTGEMDVEVELERQPRAGYTSRPPQYGRPMEVEVELEQPAPRGRGRRPRLHAPEMSPVAGAVAVGAAVAISGLVARLLHRRGEMDVEVELEQQQRPAYQPSAQPRTAYTARRDYAAPATGGEMEVEVELESRATAGYTEAGTGAQGSPSRPGAGSQAQGEMQVEVDLEPRAGGSQPSAGDDPDGGRGRDPQSPPLM
ncbi:MAG TPA: hypothetical protein VF541_17210, partial [Longimicrobium sp.]